MNRNVNKLTCTHTLAMLYLFPPALTPFASIKANWSKGQKRLKKGELEKFMRRVKEKGLRDDQQLSFKDLLHMKYVCVASKVRVCL